MCQIPLKKMMCCAGAALALHATRALAADDSTRTNTLELGMSVGYTQGIGPTGAATPRVQDLGKAGAGVALDAGWRLHSRWMVGAYGELGLTGGASSGRTDSARTLAAGLQVQHHLLPWSRLDPWVSIGFGWRGYWADLNGRTYGLQGLDLARIRVGLEQRLSPSFALGPVVGATITEFLSASPFGANGYHDLSDKRLNTFVYAGFGGRFDL